MYCKLISRNIFEVTVNFLVFPQCESQCGNSGSLLSTLAETHFLKKEIVDLKKSFYGHSFLFHCVNGAR